MNVQTLYEYTEFAKYLNFSSAARALHLSQSSLSKHMADLEKELGFTLIFRKNKPTLTPAGKLFLEHVEDALFSLNRVIEECKGLQHDYAGKIIIQDPLIDATIGAQSVKTFMYFSEEYPLVEIKLHTIRGETITEALNQGTVDIGYLMAYGKPQDIIAERKTVGINAFPLRKRRYSVWMRKDHPLAKRERLDVSDLEEYPFLIPADRLFDDWRIVLENICQAHGFTPKINSKVTATINGYFMLDTKNGIVILSDAFLEDPRFLMRSDMITHKFTDDDCEYTLFAVYKSDNDNPLLPLFVKQLSSDSVLLNTSQ
jgi:DNA-binding transcriptional LysR family regulator